MTTPLPLLTITPAGAADTYARTAEGSGAVGEASGNDFGAALGRALQGAVDAGSDADKQSLRAIQGAGNITEVATAVSRAELALQGVVAIRDKVVAAYQDVMRMPI